MRVNLEWLSEWVGVDGDADRLAEDLTTAGLEVDAVLPAAPPLEGVVVAEVVECAPHPNADKLSVCIVDDGAGRHEVVCGAPNVRAGVKAAFARVGTRLPGGTTIAEAAFRGVTSHGMLCSAAELELADDVDGILFLDSAAPVGTPIAEHLKLRDSILDIDITPNRGDCFSVVGIAREIAAKRGVPLRAVEFPAVPRAVPETFPVELQAGADCPRFAGRVIRGVPTGLESPLWLRERLRRAGQRAIHPIVDVTNYVMLELGQPLHAYDLSKLRGRIVVRRGEAGETLELLDGRTVELDEEVLVIADESGAIGMAGIMGGASTAVSAKTTDVFLESAFFAPKAVAGRARRFGLHTDASMRFERGVDPEGQARAVERATALLLDIAGGRPGPTVVSALEAHLPRRPVVPLRRARVASLLGVDVGGAEVEALLSRLGIELERTGEGAWDAVPPSFRFDISIEEDLIEEIGRLIGYDRIPVIPGAGPVHLGTATEQRVDDERLADVLVARGYHEIVSYGFVDAELDRAVSGGAPQLALANPISADLNVMRTSLWPGLLLAARQNLARQRTRLRLFEIGREFAPAPDGAAEAPVVAGLAVGSRAPEHWNVEPAEVDFFDVKADVEALLKLTGAAAAFRFEPAPHPALHPGQSARVLRDGREAGWIGALHPELEHRLELRRRVLLFALRLDVVTPAEVPVFQPYSRLPAVRRDLALVVDEAVSAAALVEEARRAAGEWLQEVVIFDVYTGEGIEAGRKSVALGLILQGVSRTLTDADADRAVGAVTQRLERELGAKIRI
ncbi:MAG TPA: phenylalanine--tRNA ligase subunit beta [Gammaproteobacteria bacterium]